MSAWERQKATAAGRAKATMLAAVDAIDRIADAFERNEIPAQDDRQRYLKAARRHKAGRDCGKSVSLDEAWELDGGRGLDDAIAFRARDDRLRDLHARFLPRLTPRAAARKIVDVLSSMTREGGSSPAAGTIEAELLRIALLKGGVPRFRQLARVLDKRDMTPPGAFVPAPHVPVRRGSNDAKNGDRRDASTRNAPGGGRDRRKGSGAHGGRGPSIGAPAFAPDRAGHDR